MILIFFGLVSVSCPSVDSVRRLWHQGLLDQALQSSDCFESERAGEIEALVLRHQILWQAGRTREALHLASQLLRSPLNDPSLERLLTKRLSRFSLGARYAFVDHSISRYDHRGRLDVGARVLGPNRLGLYYENDYRHYDSETLQDHRVGILPTWVVSPRFYVETEAAMTLKADFWSQSLWGLHTHWVVPKVGDLGLGLRFQDYAADNTWVVVATWSHEFDILSWTLRSDWLLKPVMAVAGAGEVSVPFRSWRVALRAGGGKSDEGDGVTDRFHRYGGMLRLDLSQHWALIADVEWYGGRRRQEVQGGGGFQWIF